MKKVFNQKEYIAEYNKVNYKQFKAKIKNNEMEKINNLLSEKNMNKTELVKFGVKILEGDYKMFKKIYYIEKREVKDDIITNQEFNSKKEAEAYWNHLKNCNINSMTGDKEIEYSFSEWTVECDEDGEPLENIDGKWDTIDSFITNKIL